MNHWRKLRAFLITVTLFFLSVSILIYQNITYNDKKLHVIFCDVGQGDAIFIRTPDGADILVDAGPDDKVLSCLGKHMPFWDRELELVILTHPHSDHFIGLFSVLKTYKVKSFATEDLKNKTLGFGELMRMIKNQAIPIRFVFAGDRFVLKDRVILEVVGPTQEFLRETSREGTIGESGEFASVEAIVSFGKFSALLTGDSQVSELGEILLRQLADQDDIPLSILQVPHHGSKTGLTAKILDFLNPKLAVISVAAKNKYGHPAASTLEILKDKDIKILRTDEDGEVEVISDGKNFQIRSKISNKQ